MAVVGAWFFMTVRRAWKLSTKTMITIGISVYMTLVLYAVITPLINPKYGMRFKWEGWVMGLCIGFIISTFFSSTRVMLSELCPEGDENEWFSIYLLADKGSSWLGPLVTGLIYGVTKDYRTAFWFPLGLIIIGSVMLYFVDVDLGKDQAKAFTQAKREEKMSSPC
ncbi:Autophagy protein 22 [Lunasporangiospora selenospora]|uniref:Autophagy-related protein n=1 Tax=Lunasporangiospora selenospora TaxID=979761 RepID=A0A9P6FMF4_9FUNG|nr:Autophagy protein 22 [Lunasporangiospora selenospora]